jgi:ABC-2 type transport system permease protein
MMRVFWQTFLIHLKNTLARPMFQVVLIVQPFVVATTAYMVFRGTELTDFTAYVILGGGLSGIWSAMTFSSAGDINRERWYGTLNPLLASPTPLSWVFLAKITANALLSLIALVISFLYSFVMMGSFEAIPHGAAFLLALCLFLFSASTFALCLSTLFLLSRSTTIMQNFLEYPLLLLCGLVFPVSFLPEWVQGCAALFPMRWSSAALRQTFASNPLGEQWWLLNGMAFVMGLIYLGLAVQLFARIEYRVRQIGNLEIA